MNKKVITPELAIGGQPSVAELETLKSEGFRSIVNLRRADETSPMNPEQEREAVEALGLKYEHIPIQPQALHASQAEQFSNAIHTLPKPIFIHCQGGTRAGGMTMMHLGREAGWNGDQAFAEGEKAGYVCESGAIRQFVNAFLEQNKMHQPE